MENAIPSGRPAVDGCEGLNVKTAARPSRKKKCAKKGGLPAGGKAIRRAKERREEEATQVLERVLVFQGARQKILEEMRTRKSSARGVHHFLKKLEMAYHSPKSDPEETRELESAAIKFGVNLKWCLQVFQKQTSLVQRGVPSFFSKIVSFVRWGEDSKQMRAVLADRAKLLGLDFGKCLEDARRRRENPAEFQNLCNEAFVSQFNGDDEWADYDQIALELDIPQLWREFNLPGESGKCVKSPFCKKTKPSFSVYREGGRWRFRDDATGDHGDSVDFLRLALSKKNERECDRGEALEWSRNFLKLPKDGSKGKMAPPEWLEWQKEFEAETGKSAKAAAAEYFRWFEEKRAKADADRSRPLVVGPARRIAETDRDLTAPAPDREEIPEILQSFRSCWVKNGKIDRESWPTKMDVCTRLGWSRGRVEGLLRGGKHPKRNVWRGGVSGKKGPAAYRVTPEGLRRVLAAFLKKVKWDCAESRAFLGELGQMSF